MIHYLIKSGDILKEQADVLICSANIYLNLSGGVGGEILRQFGLDMQNALHKHLRDQGQKYVNQGEVIPTPGLGTPFQWVLHAVAVDGWYHSSADWIRQTLLTAFQVAHELGGRTIALVALATGYGRLPMKEFAEGFRLAVTEQEPPFEKIVIVVKHETDAKLLREILGDRNK